MINDNNRKECMRVCDDEARDDENATDSMHCMQKMAVTLAEENHFESVSKNLVFLPFSEPYSRHLHPAKLSICVCVACVSRAPPEKCHKQHILFMFCVCYRADVDATGIE